jgi:hypothetical protein
VQYVKYREVERGAGQCSAVKKRTVQCSVVLCSAAK